jgi:hypothetical protein
VETIEMSVPAGDAANRAALQKVIADLGVSVNADDVDAVARSLDRIQGAAASLLQSLSFDETGERYYRLLEAYVPGGAGR